MVAPSLIPRKASERIKTNRRDAESLAKLLRAGELTAVWVPDAAHEAMRDLSRAREAAVDDLKRKRQQISSLLLRHGLHYPGKKMWGKKHRTWLSQLKLGPVGTRLAFEELMAAEREAQMRVDRLTAAIRELVPTWSLAALVTALQAMRGVELVTAVVVLAEIGDLLALPEPARADGLSRSGAVGGFDGRQRQARANHQGRQQARSPRTRRGRLELSPSPARRP